MKKKLFFAQAITLLIALAVFVLFGYFSVRKVNTNNCENNLYSSMTLAKKILKDETDSSTNKEDSLKKTSDIMTVSISNLRLTFIDKDGTVLYDSSKDSIEENHLDRPEIQNLGKIYYRFSSTLNTNMIYLASLSDDSSMYIRVALPLSTIDNYLTNTIIYSVLSFIGILIIALIADGLLIKKELTPLKEESKKLASIVQIDAIDPGDELESISLSIDETEKLIHEKVDDLTKEKEKLNFIIDNMDQGLVILDSKGNVLLINDRAKSIFTSKSAKTLSSLTILPEVHELYSKALKGKDNDISISIDYKSYLLSAKCLSTDWVGNNQSGVSLLFVDVSEQKRLENAKKDFFANASHELKSPLTSILGYTQMIKEGFLTEKNEIEDALSKIQSEGKRMNEIIIEMLELSRLETDADKKSRDIVSLKACVTYVLSLLETEKNKKNISVSIIGDDFQVYACKDDLITLIKNLYENAIRYNKNDGKVDFLFDASNGTMSVKDTGIGIAKQDQERIFERFYRVDKARSRKLGGTGLGLSIVKHIANNECIQINVDSELGCGSTFTLQFDNKYIVRDKE